MSLVLGVMGFRGLQLSALGSPGSTASWSYDLRLVPDLRARLVLLRMR